MEEIVKHINDTNASYRQPNAGDAKNTDLFLDNEHYSLFKDSGEQITVRYNKENLTKAILFISSILPRKFDQSATHELIKFSKEFVLNQLAIIDALFIEDGKPVNSFTQVWNARKDVPQKNGLIDKRFYFNGLLKDIIYTDYKGIQRKTKFTIRNYFAGGYSDLHIIKASDGIFDILISNANVPSYDNKEEGLEELEQKKENKSLQLIYYGAPGTGKSHHIKKDLKDMNVPNENIFRTTFHPDSDYSSFVGAYKPTMKKQYRYDGKVKARYYEDDDLADAKQNDIIIDKVIQYDFVPQTFIKAYTQAYNNPDENVYLIIEEINRGNCAQIFGDLFQLLDRDENGVSEYPIKADSDLKMYLEGELGIGHDGIKDGELCLPSNLYIWATMNTSDQSLFPIDSAFKRRWDWEYEPIKYKNTDWVIEIGDNKYSWTSFQRIINDKIFEATNSEDKMLGDYFVKPCNNVITEKQFINKVLFYLWNDVCKDGDGDIFKTDDNKDVKFSDLYDTNADDTLKAMMKHLGVMQSSDSEEYHGEAESPESTETERKAWSETETKRYEFWEAFLNYAQQNETFAQHFGGTKKASKDHWKNFFISGNKDFYLVAVQLRKKNAAEVQVYFDETNATYHRLFEQKEVIEQEMGVQYEWLELPDKKASVIKERKYNVDFEDKDSWKSIFDFYIERLLRMRDVFVKYSK